jgi:hypothetical protein
MPYHVLGGLSKTDGQDFFDTGKSGYDANMIDNNLEDPAGGSKKQMPTAIPSPFARFDLVKTAFKKITNTQQLKAESGTTTAAGVHDERLVSHTLDLAEFIFNSRGYAGSNLEILIWNKDTHLAKLKENSENKRLADSLELYLEQDKATYNFDKMKNIYLFKYDNAHILGSTSPVTLFCPSSSALDKLGITRV